MKKFISVCLISVLGISLTGCIKRDTMEDITVHTTVYPIEYIAKRLYGEHSEIVSIYPDGIIVDKYELTDKQIKDHSKSGLFIFNGLGKEKNYVLSMIDENNKLKIIDSTQSIEIDNDIEELWLDPSNFLMMAQNIKNGFNEYVNNHYLKNDINENYEALKIEVSNLDAKIQFLIESSDNKAIVVSNDVFKFLEKYNFKVYSLEENDNLTEKTIADVKEMIKNGEIDYIFMKQNEDINDTIQKIVEETKVELVTFHSLTNISETERKNKKDYISIMNDNIELLRNELYNN